MFVFLLFHVSIAGIYKTYEIVSITISFRQSGLLNNRTVALLPTDTSLLKNNYIVKYYLNLTSYKQSKPSSVITEIVCDGLLCNLKSNA